MASTPCIVTLTPAGQALGRRLVEALGQGEVVSADGAARETLTARFQAGRPLVCIMALGIVVRILGPLTKDKARDPPVVVVDEAGRFAISVLGGHGGGANELTKRVAQAIGALPVITTASDALGLPALDLLGQEWGWKIEQPENLPKVMAALVRGERIAVYQEVGRDPFGDRGCLPRVKSWPIQGSWAGAIVISDSALPALDRYPTVIYRPPSLVLGVGCKRGVPAEEIETLFEYLCRTRGFSPLSLGLVASAALKADEPGLVQFAAKHGVPLQCFALAEIALVADIPTPSRKVKEKIGVLGVAEPAAMLAAKTNTLVMTKYAGKRVAMALARREV